MERDQLKRVKAALAQTRAKKPEGPPAEAAPPSDAEWFRQQVGQVQPVLASPRVLASPDRQPPQPRQRWLDEQAALREAWSDDFDVETLLDTDEALSFHRPELGPDVPRKLRRGHWSIQAELDLHGLTRDAARDALATFLHQATRRGARCVRVVHGKGLGSPGRAPVLKGKVRAWLTQDARVLAFVQAPRSQGGHGAVLVLLAG